MRYHQLRTIVTPIVALLLLAPVNADRVAAQSTEESSASMIPGTWQPLLSGTSAMLWDVFGTASYTLSVGANGELLIFDGDVWNHIPTPTTLPLYGVWGPSADNIFLVGSAGRVYRFDGAVVSQMPFVTSANLFDIWGRSSQELFAAGANGTIIRFDGDRWNIVQTPTVSLLRDIEGTPGNGPVIAVGNAGVILRLENDTWRLEDTPTTANLRGTWISRTGIAFAVGNGGIVLRNDGGGWVQMETPTTANLNDVWGTSDSQVFAVGDNGTLLFFDGSRWNLTHVETSAKLNGIHNGFAVGANGTVQVNPTMFREAFNLRITELIPASGQVEVSNFGVAFTSGTHPFCHLLDCDSSIPAGTMFEADDIQIFGVPGMNRIDSDLWLERTFPFDDPNNLIHGVKYGPDPAVVQTAIAVEAKRWTSPLAFTPAPPTGASLAYDGFGFDPKDWYVDETPTMGGPNVTIPGTVPPSLPDLMAAQKPIIGVVLTSSQDFEALSLGDEVFAIDGWTIDDASNALGAFTARSVGDVNGDVDQGSQSTRWLRIRDQANGDVAGDVHSPTIEVPPGAMVGYQWVFSINVEQRSGEGPNFPRFMIQHGDDGFASAWGVELRPDNICLVVTDFGGDKAAECSLGSPPPLGEWIRLRLSVSLTLDVVSLFANGNLVAVLPIDSFDPLVVSKMRFTYEGSGQGNSGTTLLDDIVLDVVPPVQPFFSAVSADAVENDVSVSWSVVSQEPAAGFVVYRQTDDEHEVAITGPLSADVRYFADDGLPTGHTYGYTIGALIEDGKEVRSQKALVEIEALPVAVFKEFHALRLTDAVRLEWDLQLNEPIAGFRVYRMTNGSQDEVDITGGNLLSDDTRQFEDRSVRPGESYAHVVAVVTTKGTEIRSGMSSVAFPAPPLKISRVFPNPFAVSTTLDFSLAEPGNVRVSVYDVQGKLVTHLLNGDYRPGDQSVTWNGLDANGRRVSAGTYFFKMHTKGAILTRKVVVVR